MALVLLDGPVDWRRVARYAAGTRSTISTHLSETRRIDSRDGERLTTADRASIMIVVGCELTDRQQQETTMKRYTDIGTKDEATAYAAMLRTRGYAAQATPNASSGLFDVRVTRTPTHIVNANGYAVCGERARQSEHDEAPTCPECAAWLKDDEGDQE